MADTARMGRKLIALTPVLLVAGIVAQTILLAAAIVLYVPCLIWPRLLNGPYRMITKGMARTFAKGIMGRKQKVNDSGSSVIIP